jgi:hypothetical protein
MKAKESLSSRDSILWLLRKLCDQLPFRCFGDGYHRHRPNSSPFSAPKKGKSAQERALFAFQSGTPEPTRTAGQRFKNEPESFQFVQLF